MLIKYRKLGWEGHLARIEGRMLSKFQQVKIQEIDLY